MAAKAKRSAGSHTRLTVDWLFVCFWVGYFTLEVAIAYALIPMTEQEALSMLVGMLTLIFIWLNRSNAGWSSAR